MEPLGLAAIELVRARQDLCAAWIAHMRYSTLERAFQLAEKGPPATLKDIRVVLKAEGYDDAITHTSFHSVQKQLRQAMQRRLAAAPATDLQKRARTGGMPRLNSPDAR